MKSYLFDAGKTMVNRKNVLCSILSVTFNSSKKNFAILAFFVVFNLISTACSTLSGGNEASGTDGGQGTSPSGVIINSSENLYVSTFAGSGTIGYADGQGISAQFRNSQGMAVDRAGNLYVADGGNDRIRKIDRTGNVSTLAGNGITGSANGQKTLAQFNFPQGIAVDSAGNVFVADSFNHLIRKIDKAGNVSTLAGAGTFGYADGQGRAAKFNYPEGIAVDNAGDIIVADTLNHRIRKIDRTGNVSTLAGSGITGSANGQKTLAQFNFPYDVAVDGAGNVYVADGHAYLIRKIDNTGNVSTLAGDGTRGYADGRATSAKFSYLSKIAVDGAGNVYVADAGNNRIRKIDSTGNVSTLAGSGTEGYADGYGISAQFKWPNGVVVDGVGNVYVVDRGNNRIRKISHGQPSENITEIPKIRLGELIGTVGGFEGADIIVNGKDTIGIKAPIGRALIVDANGQYVYLQSTFPMQTVVKCRVTSGDRVHIKKGMKVYLKP